jgi:hypothetical protein
MHAWFIKLAGDDVWQILPIVYQQRVVEKLHIYAQSICCAVDPDGDRSHMRLLSKNSMDGAEIKEIEIDDLIWELHRKNDVSELDLVTAAEARSRVRLGTPSPADPAPCNTAQVAGHQDYE